MSGERYGKLMRCSVALPEDFRPGATFAFHGRDRSGLAERVGDATLVKGLAWEGRAARLVARFHRDRVEAELAVDGPGAKQQEDALRQMLERMLGLAQPIAEFERAYREHPLIGRLIAHRPGLRVPVSPTPFEALTWAITGQQISVVAALSLRRKLIEAAGLRHSSGIACYPDGERVAGLDEADLRSAGFSRSKAVALIALATAVRSGEVPIDAWTGVLPADEIRERLLNVRGIGPWTADYTLLRGFGCLDGSLHGDVAVRRNLQALLGGAEKIGEGEARRWLAQFSPWRALIAAHLWAMQSPDVY